MATKKRTIEVHKLTISGLPDGTDYLGLLRDSYKKIPDLPSAVWEYGKKSHAIHTLSTSRERLRMQFLSYTTGYRPDILDTQKYSIRPNPLSDTQTGIEWTHVLAGNVGDRYLLLIEKVQAGIWPETIEGYFQWLIDEFPPKIETSEPLVVSIEAEPSEAFLERLGHLKMITHAKVRMVRPNPGWADLEGELGEVAAQSDAHKAEIQMVSRRKHSLNRDSGIVAAIKSLFKMKKLDYAEIAGRGEKKKEHFSTEKLGQKELLDLELDHNGQVLHEDAWYKLDKTMDDLK